MKFLFLIFLTFSGCAKPLDLFKCTPLDKTFKEPEYICHHNLMALHCMEMNKKEIKKNFKMDLTTPTPKPKKEEKHEG